MTRADLVYFVAWATIVVLVLAIVNAVAFLGAPPSLVALLGAQ